MPLYFKICSNLLVFKKKYNALKHMISIVLCRGQTLLFFAITVDARYVEYLIGENFVGENFRLRRGKFSSGKIFVGENFRRGKFSSGKIFVGDNFRHLKRFRHFSPTKILPDSKEQLLLLLLFFSFHTFTA